MVKNSPSAPTVGCPRLSTSPHGYARVLNACAIALGALWVTNLGHNPKTKKKNLPTALRLAQGLLLLVLNRPTDTISLKTHLSTPSFLKFNHLNPNIER